MATVTVTVIPYPEATSDLEIEELSPFTGWASASDVSAASELEGVYTATVTSATHRLRYRWAITAGGHSRWLTPLRVLERREPTAAQEAQLKEAMISKAARIYVMTGASLGYVGEISEMGSATLRPDYQIRELLEGLRFIDWDVDLTAIVDADEVIRAGLGADPTSYTAAQSALVDQAIAAAASWVATEIIEGVAIV